MKKFFLVLAFLFTTISFVFSAQNVLLAWNPSPDPNVAGYKIYYKTTAAPNYSVTNVAGATTTNVTIQGLIESTVYQFYATAYDTNNLESDSSNQIRYQFFYVNGSKSTPLTLGDAGTTNFPSFILISSPTNGTITGVVPNVTFSPTSVFASAKKDSFVYRNPEMAAGFNITNYYAVYKVNINNPPVIRNATPQ